MNKFCGYKTAIFKVLNTYYKKDNPWVDPATASTYSANFVLSFFNDFPKIWDMLTSCDVYNYKVLNDKRMVEHQIRAAHRHGRAALRLVHFAAAPRRRLHQPKAANQPDQRHGQI